jgi:hypothetical protein
MTTLLDGWGAKEFSGLTDYSSFDKRTEHKHGRTHGTSPDNGQRTEAAVGVAVLNRMLHTGRLNSVRRSQIPSLDALGRDSFGRSGIHATAPQRHKATANHQRVSLRDTA